MTPSPANAMRMTREEKHEQAVRGIPGFMDIALRCLRCDHQWYPRRPVEPKVCPKCKSKKWNLPRRR